MEEDQKEKSFSLPPGCRFHPSEEQLLCHYLSGKNANANSDRVQFEGFDLIKELDLYGCDPFDLPGSSCYSYGRKGGKKHWYCYTEKGSRGKRTARSGYWRKTGWKKVTVGRRGGKVVLGDRTSFVFYLGNSPNSAVATDMVLYEYNLVDHLEASFVLCRVFVKPKGANSLSAIGVSSCAEESSAVRHIGIQHDEINTEILDSKLNGDDSFGRKDDIVSNVIRPDSELDNPTAASPVPVAETQLPLDIQHNEQVTSSLSNCSTVNLDALTAEDILSILNDDFIELDDLFD